MKQKIAIAGAGFSGAVLARELAESGRHEIWIFDERPNVGGNCHTTRDESTGIMLHQYGPHIFGTSRDDVWSYVNRWSTFMPFVNRVKAVTDRGVFSLPINLLTINQFFKKSMGPSEAREFIDCLGDRNITTPQNFEQQALKLLGHELYDAFLYGYTKKQWGVEPTELPASILSRMPIRFNYDDNYSNHKYSGIPVDGYTAVIERILDHPLIHVKCGTRFNPSEKSSYDHLFWSGSIDGYFNFARGRLGYRSLKFERFDARGDHQGNPVINYCEEEIPYTRITEHKHFTPWESHEQTVYFREYSKFCEPGDTPYYPLQLNNSISKALLADYVALAEQEQQVTFLGRLGTYRYLDMHVVIAEALELAKHCLAPDSNIKDWPRFSKRPE